MSGHGTEHPSLREPPADASRVMLSQQGTGSVNEALARGLRTRIVKDVAAAEIAMMKLANSSARTRCAPTTQKGFRRFFKEQTRILSRLLLAPPADLLGGRYGVWLCWHTFDEGDGIGHERGDLGVIAHVADLGSGLATAFALPSRLRPHLIDRTFQRLGTTDAAAVLSELSHVALLGVVLGIVMAHQQGPSADTEASAESSFPLMLPTPSGAILGDALLDAPYVCMNTYIGGRRPLTPSKERLRAALANELATVTTAHMEEILRGYFVGMISKQASGRLEEIREQSLKDCFALMRRISVILDRNRCSLLSKEEREDSIKRNDLYWKWATLQHQAQQAPA